MARRVGPGRHGRRPHRLRWYHRRGDQSLRNLEAQPFATQGAQLSDVVKTTVFLRHMSDYAQMNEAYIAASATTAPARSAVGISELPLGALVEVEAWAYVGG